MLGFPSRNREQICPAGPSPTSAVVSGSRSQAADRKRHVHTKCSPRNSQTSSVFVNTIKRSASPRTVKEQELAGWAALLQLHHAFSYEGFFPKLLKPNEQVTGSTFFFRNTSLLFILRAKEV